MVTMENYEEYLLLYTDGELNEAEQKELLAFIGQHPELKAEMDIYATTKLVPDEAMVYHGKEELLKKAPTGRTITFRSWGIYGAAAACIAIMIAIGLSRNGETNEVATPVTVATNHTAENKTDTNTSTAFHSTPKDPVAVETKKEANKTVYIARTKTNRRIEKHIKQPVQPTVVAQTNTPAVKEIMTVPEPVIQNSEPIKKNIPPVAEIAAHEKEPTETIEPMEQKKEKKLLALIPIKEDQVLGINALSKTVNRNIEKVKDFKNKLRDTDLSFKIGKKELFVVRL